MNVGVVNSVMLASTPLRKREVVQANANKIDSFVDSKSLPSVKSISVLSQMPNVSFGAKRNYGKDSLSAYDNYSGPRPPEIEIKKYIITRQVAEYIENEDYLSAIKGKLRLAEICKKQGKDSDAFILEESVRKLYKDLPKYQRSEAKSEIADYNVDMATYIDRDINRF